ncbi:MAG: hypothetical protein LQ341_004893 [Variospora aurantia]|nr:MAG: hypothetical protein LQ341_004893 [Variospora aurantia]
MATSVLHTASQSYPPLPPPPFSQESAGSSLSGAHLSQGAMQSFDGTRSMAATPTPTPPASRGHHQISSFNTAAYPVPNGIPIQQAPSKRYHEANGIIPQHQYPPGHKPQIYTAVYSSVSVYEMEVNQIAVMRRRSDSWLNATQILKVAGIDKGKRTKVLEKEILSGEHEKVQGGYGKYQGTWVNYRRGVDFCRQYGVADLLRPLLEYDMGQDGNTSAGQGHINTPTKEQAMAAQRKRNMAEGIFNHRPSSQSQNGTFFRNLSKETAQAVSAINNARVDSNVSSRTFGRPSTTQSRPPSQQMFASQESSYQPGSQQSNQSMHSDHNFSIDPALRAQNPSFLDVDGHDEANEPPRKRARPSSSQEQNSYHVGDDNPMMELTPTNASFLHPNSQQQLPPNVTGLPPLPAPVTASAQQKQELLLTLFQDDQSWRDFSTHPAITRLSGEELDIPIDKSAHTAMHWAATLGRIKIVRALISKGASPYRVNGGGETALMRAAITTNNFDNHTFPEALKLLGTSLEIRDGRGQTVLHHIAASSAIKGRGQATRYYLDSILLYVVGNSAPNSQQNSFDGSHDASGAKGTKLVNLGDFMTYVVNAQDLAGDTALHCAAKVGNKAIVEQLLEVGADQSIANRLGLRPSDIPGVSGDQTDIPFSSQAGAEDDDHANKVKEATRELQESVKTCFEDMDKAYLAERRKKQLLFDQLLIQLRENVSQLAEEKRRLQVLEEKSEERKNLKTKVDNLRRANHSLRQNLGNRHDLKTDVEVGKADAGLEIEPSRLPPLEPYSTAADTSSSEHQYLETLPPTEVLQARAEAYRANNDRLEAQVKELQGQSSDLEARLKQVVSHCTKVDIEMVDELLPGLLDAVESEKSEDLETSRLSELLREIDREAEVGRG